MQKQNFLMEIDIVMLMSFRKNEWNLGKILEEYY